METEIFHLNLISPLRCVPQKGADPFNYQGGPELIFCFELDKKERLSFEPDGKKLLGNLIFGGQAGAGDGELPGGNYLFAQKREVLRKEDIIALAVEIQMEALWQRRQPGEMLYLRYLFEDGSPVTQLFRPVRGLAEQR